MVDNKSFLDNSDPNIINEYYRWLTGLVDVRSNYSLLLHDLHAREFYYILEQDENRAKDGKYLRYSFGEEKDISNAETILSGPCSILEMLIALAGRFDGGTSINFDMERPNIKRHFWMFLDNLDLKHAVDQFYDPSEVHHILDRWMFREYSANGSGGIFPLKYPEEDQREVEIWKQMQAYCRENFNDFEFD